MLDEVVLRLRAASTTFGQNIAGAAEFAQALEEGTFDAPIAFVVPGGDQATENEMPADISSILRDRFSVFLVLDNTADELGTTAANQIPGIRAEIWKAIWGYKPSGYENAIQYEGGDLGPINGAYLTYQLRFYVERQVDLDDGYSGTATDDFLRIRGIDDLVTNGDFGVGTGWTLGDGWTIAGGLAQCDGSQGAQSDLSQELKLTSGRTYKLKATVTVSQGTLTPILGGTSGTPITGNGDVEEDLTAGSTDAKIVFRASTDFIGTIDNAQVKSGFGIETGMGTNDVPEAEIAIDLPS